jgi:hypothetical protein
MGAGTATADTVTVDANRRPAYQPVGAAYTTDTGGAEAGGTEACARDPYAQQTCRALQNASPGGVRGVRGGDPQQAPRQGCVLGRASRRGARTTGDRPVTGCASVVRDTGTTKRQTLPDQGKRLCADRRTTGESGHEKGSLAKTREPVVRAGGVVGEAYPPNAQPTRIADQDLSITNHHEPDEGHAQPNDPTH